MLIRIKYFPGAEKIKVRANGDWIDLKANENVVVKAGKMELIPLGVAMKLPEGYEAHLAPRSSTFKKFGILQTNSVGVIDNSYSGPNDEWKFPAFNPGPVDLEIHKGERICQFRIMERQPEIEFVEDDLSDQSDRGGFGSTGVN
jgi:dUTP pyrophosphatase